MDSLRRFFLLFAVAVAVSSTAVAEIPIGGRVLGPDGQGLKGILVGLEPTRPDYERVDTRLGGAVGPGSEAAATTDADGFFELLAPRLGPWKVVVPWRGDGEVTSKDYVSREDYVSQEYLLSPLFEATEILPVRLEPASILEVRVVDPEGVPADARIGIYDTRRSPGRWRTRLRLARTGDDGVARLARGGDEELRLELLGPSHPLLIFSGDELTGSRQAAGTGSIESIELRLAPGVTGTARVTDGRGRALAGAVAYQGFGILPLGRTDAEGLLELVVAPVEYQPPAVSFLTRDGYRGYFEPRFSPDEKTETSVALEPLLTVRGRVIDRQSRDPVEGAVVWVADGAVTETDARGAYELRLFPTRWVAVQAVAPGYGQAYERKEIGNADTDDGPTVALAPAAVVRGRVVDAEGNPVAGVEVTTVPLGNAVNRRSVYDRQPRRTRSTRRGQFSVSGLVPSVSHELRFRKQGFAPSRHKVEGLEAFEDRGGLHVVLSTGRSAVGWVTDESDAPVPGALVRLVTVVSGDPRTAARTRLDGSEEAELPASHTDAEGRFQLSHLAPGRYNLEVEATGFAAAAVPGIRVEPGMGETDFGTVVLVPGVRIEGIVRDPEGAALADAEIHVAREDRAIFLGRAQPDTRSDAWGRFVLPDLRTGEQVRLAVSKAGFSAETVSAVAADGETVAVVLRPAGVISGRVLTEDGDPVAEAYVYANPMDMSRQRYTYRTRRRPGQTDDRGTFRIEDVDPGAVRLSVNASGYQRYELRDLKVPPGGEVSGVEVVLVRGATITGTVSRADRTPVVQAMVHYAPPQESTLYSGFQLSAETDSEGHFRLAGVPPGPAVISARQGDHSQVSKSVVVGPGAQTVDLVFEGGFEVSGRVTDTAGLPVAGAALTLNPIEARYRRILQNSQSLTTGPNGTFTLTDVAAGLYRITAAKEGYAHAATPEPFEVRNGPVGGIELELRRGATLRGRILGLELDDLADVVVHAYGGVASGMLQGVVDYEGRYSLPNLGPGPWSVTARLKISGRQAAGQLTVTEGETEVELDLEFRTGFPLGGVVTSGGEPLAGARIWTHGLEPGLGNANTMTSADGRFLLSHLPAGSYNIQVMSGSLRTSREVVIPAAEEVLIEIEAAWISGHVLDEAGDRPLPGTALRLERVDKNPASPYSGMALHRGLVTDSRGYFSLNAQEGVWRVIATKAGHGPAETTVEVHAGGRYEGLEIRMSPTDGVTFEVVLESGAVPSQVMAAVLDASGQALSQGFLPVGEGGTVHLSTVPSGTWELIVQAGNSATVTMPITAPGHVGQVRLSQGGILRIRVPALEGQRATAQVRLTGPDGRPHYTLDRPVGQPTMWPLWNGEATISRLRPGVWKLTITHYDGRTWTSEATVAAGATSEVVVP